MLNALLKLGHDQLVGVVEVVTPKDPTHLDSTGLNWFWNVQNPTTGRKTDEIIRIPVESRFFKSGDTKILVWPL